MFFSDWRQKRQLQKEIDKIERDCRANLDLSQQDEASIYFQMVDSETYSLRRKLTWLQEKPIRRTAERLGIDIDREWLEPFDHSEAITRLSSSGEAKLRRLIRQQHRESVEWWVKLVTPIITVLTGLIAALVALLSFLRR